MDTAKQSPAQNVKLKCRVCTKEIYRKNYKVHLQTSHPSHNSHDLSPLGQAKITSLFSATPPDKKTRGASDQQKANAVADFESPATDNLTDIRKRRHESGESVESGYFESCEGVSGEKKQKDDDDSDEEASGEKKQKDDKNGDEEASGEKNEKDDKNDDEVASGEKNQKDDGD